jgi:hypothetical protein
MHPGGERPSVPHGRCLNRRRLNRIVDHQPHVGRFGPETSLGHDLPRADHRQRDNRQSSLDRQQKAAGLEVGDVAVRTARALGVDQEREAFS